MQGTPAWSLVWEDSTYLRAIMPMSQTTEPAHPRAWVLQQEKPSQWETHTLQLERSPHLQLEKAHVQQWRSSGVKNK